MTVPRWARGLAHAGVAFGAAVLLSRCGGSSPTTPTPPPTQLPAPVVDSPLNGTEVATQRPTLTVINVFSAQTTPKTYDFQLSDVADFTRFTATRTGVAEGSSGKTSVTLEQDLSTNTSYYWRARAMQGTSTGAWSVTTSFRVGQNTPPVIKSITARGTRVNEPASFADLDETINVTAVAEDAQVSADRLIYEWSSASGTFTGTGAAVQWRAPATLSTPAKVTLTLTVRDAPAPGGASATSTVIVDVHDSVKEIGDMSYQFLVDFSKQLAPADVLKNFSPTCPGTSNELADTQRNQRCFKIDSYAVGAPVVKVNFDGTCTFRSRSGDACTAVPVQWRSTVISAAAECGGGPVGTKGVSTGTDWVTAVYEGSRWYLCDSDFEGTSTPGSLFKR
jgi:hypothetical protein